MERKPQNTIIKNCKVHGETEFAIVNGTNKTYCRKCQREKNIRLRNKLKQQCYEYLGNKCSRCGKVQKVYDFHHMREKEYGISQGITKYFSFEKLKSELDKCILLCGNCHAELHYEEDSQPSVKLNETFKQQINRHKLKEECIQYLGGKCFHCDYDKCKDALVFHHINPEEKEFGIGDAIKRNFSFIKIKSELDKCQLLCRNCHSEKHIK